MIIISGIHKLQVKSREEQSKVVLRTTTYGGGPVCYQLNHAYIMYIMLHMTPKHLFSALLVINHHQSLSTACS